jgi:hypothetical protein
MALLFDIRVVLERGRIEIMLGDLSALTIQVGTAFAYSTWPPQKIAPVIASDAENLMISVLLTWAALAASPAPMNVAATHPETSAVARDWTDASGTKRVRAQLIRIDGDTLWLKRPNGKLATTTVSQLSPADRQYVATGPLHSGADPKTNATLASLPAQVLSKIGDQAKSIAALPKWSPPSQPETKARMIPAAVVYMRVSREFLEDYVERKVNRTKPVRDYILGTRVVGESDTHGNTRLELLPTSGKLSAKISFEGTVRARTEGYNGPVVLHQIADSTFRASKNISLDSSGLKVTSAEASAPTHLTTMGIDSSLPRLRGRIATRIAWRRLASSNAEAERITANHTAATIGDDFDASVDRSMAKLQDVFKSKIPELSADGGTMTAEVRFRTNVDSIEMAMVRVDAADAERRLRPPGVHGNPDVAVRVHRAILTHAVADPHVREDLAPFFAKLLNGRIDRGKSVAASDKLEQVAESAKWSIDPDWLTLDFDDPRH